METKSDIKAPTRYELTSWHQTAKPGDQFIYHTGYLFADRVERDGLVRSQRAISLGQLADKAMQLSEIRFGVHLTQRRLGDFLYQYIATRAG